MLWSRRLSLVDLIDLCQSLRYPLASGLLMREVMSLIMVTGTRPIQRAVAGLDKDLKAGYGLEDALRRQGRLFPTMFVAAMAVGEQSGNLPEVLAELEQYYRMQQELRRGFVMQTTYALVQLLAAIAIVATLIYALGFIAFYRRGGPTDPLGIGLVGTRGAFQFLAIALGALAFAAVGFWLMTRLLGRRVWVQRALLRLPAIGPCLQSVALTRFCVASHLMLETSISVVRTVRLAFLSTDIPGFIAALPQVETGLKQGHTIAASLGRGRVFPKRFLAMVAMAEESGRLPEVLRGQSADFHEDAKRRLAWLSLLTSSLIRVLVACLIALAIVRLYQTVYIHYLDTIIEMQNSRQKIYNDPPRLPPSKQGGEAGKGPGT
jgi:type II secretory pathway component PulF